MNANKYNFQRHFLLEFTKHIIQNTTTSEVLKLKKILEERELLFKKPKEHITTQAISAIIQVKEKELFRIKEQYQKPAKFNLAERKVLPSPNFSIPKPSQPRRLKIPDTKLPKNLQYLKPVPIELEIDLGKLNPFLQDPAVEIVECHGADQEIIVKGRMGTKPTELKLTKEEIDGVINKFSQESKIPTNEGIYKVAFGKLIISAIISNVLGSKFIISRIQQPQTNQPQKAVMPGQIRF